MLGLLRIFWNGGRFLKRLSFVGTLCLAMASYATTYSVADLSPNNPVGRDTYATGLNDDGTVVGVVIDDTLWNAAVFKGGNMEVLADPYHPLNDFAGGSGIAGPKINASETIVGSYRHNEGPAVIAAFEYSNGTFTDLESLLGGIYETANGINEAGQVVGLRIQSGLAPTAYFLDNGAVTDINLPQNQRAGTVAMNSLGQVVVSSVKNQIFFYDPQIGTPTLLGPGYAYAINDSQVMVGSAVAPYPLSDVPAIFDPAGNVRTIIECPGAALDINATGMVVGAFWQCSGFGEIEGGFVYDSTDPNAVLMSLTSHLSPDSFGWRIYGVAGINSSGQIAASAVSPTDRASHAVLLTPMN